MTIYAETRHFIIKRTLKRSIKRSKNAQITTMRDIIHYKFKSKNDPNGSYTGNSEWDDDPEQDADDL